MTTTVFNLEIVESALFLVVLVPHLLGDTGSSLQLTDTRSRDLNVNRGNPTIYAL